jgi:hypothetical protein
VSKRDNIRLASLGLLCGMVCMLGGCVATYYPVDPPYLVDPPPYMVLPVDESMTCNGIASSFRFAARRAARLEYWLSVGPLAGYDNARFPLDAPKQLVDERRRLDALSDLQRYKGCTVMEPGPAVVEERARLEGSIVPPPPPQPPPAVLKSRG